MDKRNEADREEKKRKRTLRRVAAFIAAGMVSVLFITYLAGVFYFQSHYFKETIIDGTDYSFADRQESEQTILHSDVPYTLHIVGREGLEGFITAAEIGMVYQFDDSLVEFNESQPGWKWPGMFFSDSVLELERSVVFNDLLLQQKIKMLPFFQKENLHKPEDAYISAYQPHIGYVVVPEYPGTMLDFDLAETYIYAALEEMEEQLNLTGDDLYVQPALLQQDPGLKQAIDTANLYVGTEIIYRWNGQTEVLNGDLIHEWIHVGDDTAILDEEQVKLYVASMAKKHDTYGRERDFLTSSGDIMRLKSGSYGWWTDRAGETAALIEAIKNGESTQREPLYHCRGYAEGSPGADIGSSYVEIDLGKQHLYLYIEGKLILESDFVSGNIVKGRGTPAGVFGLTYKERNATLRGENYASPVKYWMPFNGNIGMHDASWRSKFGGDIYLRQGSHGCINLPGDKAEEIYGYIGEGFPVICYY